MQIASSHDMRHAIPLSVLWNTSHYWSNAFIIKKHLTTTTLFIISPPMMNHVKPTSGLARTLICSFWTVLNTSSHHPSTIQWFMVHSSIPWCNNFCYHMMINEHSFNSNIIGDPFEWTNYNGTELKTIKGDERTDYPVGCIALKFKKIN